MQPPPLNVDGVTVIVKNNRIERPGPICRVNLAGGQRFFFVDRFHFPTLDREFPNQCRLEFPFEAHCFARRCAAPRFEQLEVTRFGVRGRKPGSSPPASKGGPANGPTSRNPASGNGNKPIPPSAGAG